MLPAAMRACAVSRELHNASHKNDGIYVHYDDDNNDDNNNNNNNNDNNNTNRIRTSRSWARATGSASNLLLATKLAYVVIDNLGVG